MAWEQYIALINLLDWYQKGFQASIQQNPVSSFLHCLFKVTCYPIVCSMSELDSRVLWSLPAKRFCCKREHNSRNHQNPWNYMLWGREQCPCEPLIRRHCYCPCKMAKRNDVTIYYLSVFISHTFAKVFVLRRKKRFHWSVLASPTSRGPICCVTAKDTRGAALFLGDDQPIEMSDDLTAFSFKSLR